MKSLRNLFSGIFSPAKSEGQKIYREWDRQRSRAMSPSEVSEIDAIFSRHA
jgi:hypothetical protein